MSKAKASNGPYTARRLSFEIWIKPGNFLVHPCVMYKRYFITKFYRMDSLPNFLTHGAPLARFARESSAIKTHSLRCGIVV